MSTVSDQVSRPVQEIPSSSSAFQVWMGQWRLNTLDDKGCIFVLRFVLSAFRARRPEDHFWKFLAQFFNTDPDLKAPKDLLAQAVVVEPAKARDLLNHLSQSYAAPSERLFWTMLNDAIQLYTVAL